MLAAQLAEIWMPKKWGGPSDRPWFDSRGQVRVSMVRVFRVNSANGAMHKGRQTGWPKPGLEVIKLEFILRLKIKRNDGLLADTCPQAANHCALF